MPMLSPATRQLWTENEGETKDQENLPFLIREKPGPNPLSLNVIWPLSRLSSLCGV
jgi:hypothetical protein